jgi:hypothetical protein
LQSKDYSTQLAVLFDNAYIKKYGYDRILDRLIKDLEILETVGIEIDGKMIKGSITYVCADSLGFNLAVFN